MFLVFPSLLFTGVSPVMANATGTFVLFPGAYASAWVYRDRLVHGRRLQGLLVLSSALGAGLGSELLLHTSEQSFSHLVPYLMLAATMIFTFAGKLRSAAASHAAKTTHLLPLLAGQFVIGIYGGYFGAGQGVLMLALFLTTASIDVHEASGIRLVCGAFSNTIATVIFAARGVILWKVGLPMVVAAVAGGLAGAHFLKRLDTEKARRAILIYAWVVTAWLLIRSFF